MSRSYCSYDEDWQRRKSVMIRSLFHDIPILSPVDEESNGSYQYAPTQETFPSPPRPYSPLPPLIIERVPITNKHDEPEEYYRKLHKKIKKIYLKLFVENRNLDSVDYDSNYNDSSIVDDNVMDSSVDGTENLDLKFLESISPGKGNFDSVIQDEEARESFGSTRSDGYEPDYESVDTEVIDILNYTASNNEETNRSEKEELESNNIIEIRNQEFDKAGTDNEESSGCNESSRRIFEDLEASEEDEESNVSATKYQKTTEREESIETEDEQSSEEEQSLPKNLGKRKIIEDTSETETSKRVRKEQDEPIEEQESNSTNQEHELAENDETHKTEDGLSYEEDGIHEHDIIIKTSEIGKTHKITIDDRELYQEEESKRSTSDNHCITGCQVSIETDNQPQSNQNTVKQKESENTSPENRHKSRDSKIDTTEDDVETSRHSSEGLDYRQITTEALVHCDGSQDEERESRVYEDSIRSFILPTRYRRVPIRHNVDIDERIEILPALEENRDPKLAPTFDTDESETTEEDFDERETSHPETTGEDIDEAGTIQIDPEKEEVESRSHKTNTDEEKAKGTTTAKENLPDKNIERMRTLQQNATDKDVEEMRSHQPDLSQETIPITRRSSSVSTIDHNAFPQEPTAMTSSSQDGGDKMSEIETSNDMTTILNSILNESQNVDKTTMAGMKRKLYVDKSVQAVQTNRVTWDEMRTNFFVGTPKIFRLCACNDHVCH